MKRIRDAVNGWIDARIERFAESFADRIRASFVKDIDDTNSAIIKFLNTAGWGK